MIEQKIEQNEQTANTQERETSYLGETALSISGTAFSTLGKTLLAVGMTGILLYLFFQLEAFVGLGAIYTGAIAVCGGLVSMVLGNKFSTGTFFEGLIPSNPIAA
jgi:preprotein translocase subunit SecF